MKCCTKENRCWGHMSYKEFQKRMPPIRICCLEGKCYHSKQKWGHTCVDECGECHILFGSPYYKKDQMGKE
jgi:hypothetical protein